jgi:hypothetical protein
MTSEYVVDSIKSFLESNIDSKVDTLEAIVGATNLAPNIAEYKVGNFLPTELTLFPALTIAMQKNSNGENEYEFQDRIARFEVVIWVVNVDAETMHRYVMRYGDAAVAVLSDEANWSNGLHNPNIGDATFSDLFETDHGLAQGVQILGSAEFILSKY